MPKESAHVTVKIPKELVEQMDKLKGKHGFRSRGEIAKEAIRHLLAEYALKTEVSLPRFEQINSDVSGVKILDRELHRVVDVIIRPSGVKCSVDETDSCPHIDFALSQHNVRELVRKKRREGWKLPEV